MEGKHEVKNTHNQTVARQNAADFNPTIMPGVLAENVLETIRRSWDVYLFADLKVLAVQLGIPVPSLKKHLVDSLVERRILLPADGLVSIAPTFSMEQTSTNSSSSADSSTSVSNSSTSVIPGVLAASTPMGESSRIPFASIGTTPFLGGSISTSTTAPALGCSSDSDQRLLETLRQIPQETLLRAFPMGLQSNMGVHGVGLQGDVKLPDQSSMRRPAQGSMGVPAPGSNSQLTTALSQLVQILQQGLQGPSPSSSVGKHMRELENAFAAAAYIDLKKMRDSFQSGESAASSRRVSSELSIVFNVPKAEAKEVSNIVEWQILFTRLKNGYVKYYPHMEAGLSAHQGFILSCAADFPPQFSQAQLINYDYQVRISHPGPTGGIGNQLGGIDFNLSLRFLQRQQTLPAPSSRKRAREENRPRPRASGKVCFDYNKESGCSRSTCHFRHACSQCDGDHAATMHQRASGNRVTPPPIPRQSGNG